jgi:hypothetical protein
MHENASTINDFTISSEWSTDERYMVKSTTFAVMANQKQSIIDIDCQISSVVKALLSEQGGVGSLPHGSNRLWDSIFLFLFFQAQTIICISCNIYHKLILFAYF